MQILITLLIIMYILFIMLVPPTNFFRDFPKDWYKIGRFKACSVLYKRFHEPVEYESFLTYYNVGIAYIVSRHKACWLDLKTKGMERTTNIGWKIKTL